MTTRRKTDAERLDVPVNIRVTVEDAKRLDDLLKRIPISTRHGLARAALRLGLGILEADPAEILGAGSKRSRARRRDR